jgi:hypothetical protein
MKPSVASGMIRVTKYHPSMDMRLPGSASEAKGMDGQLERKPRQIVTARRREGGGRYIQ